MGKRVLITGLSTFWGGLVAQALEKDPNVDVLIGLDTTEPSVELERTEYVRTDERYFRPTEVDLLHGDPSKARAKLGWQHTTSFNEMIEEMVQSDLKLIPTEKERRDRHG